LGQQDEFEMNMRLVGARSISEVVPEMVDASALRSHAGLTPADNLYNTTCTSFLIGCVYQGT
jgi:L-lactate dehydrogenase (cytochrome)